MNKKTKFQLYKSFLNPFSLILEEDEVSNCEHIYKDFFSAPMDFKIDNFSSQNPKQETKNQEEIIKTPEKTPKSLFLPKISKEINSDIKDLSGYSNCHLENPVFPKKKLSLHISSEKSSNQSFSREFSTNIQKNNIKEEVLFDLNNSDHALFSDLMVPCFFSFRLILKFNLEGQTQPI